MKIVITTQYRENYAAHDWDGQGQCPQHWKNKGGNSYVIENLTEQQAKNFLNEKTEQLYSLIENSSDYSNHYIVSIAVQEDESAVCEPWETPNIITIVEGNYVNTYITKNDQYGYMNKKIVEKQESYIMKENGNRENYQVQYLINDGNIVSSKDINDYLK